MKVALDPAIDLAALDPALQASLKAYPITKSVINGAGDQQWLVTLEDERMVLKGQIDSRAFSLFFDWQSPEMNFRRLHGGGRKEPLAKAIGIKGNDLPSVADITAGMGRESYLLAQLGCRVTAVERHPIVFLLLQDAYRRAKHLATDGNHQWQPLNLVHQDSHLWLTEHLQQHDVIYLDPMFPDRKKSAAVKQSMVIFKQLVGEDLDADSLFEYACQSAKKRVVVKRPKSARFLAGRSPDSQILSKKHRFDIYWCH